MNALVPKQGVLFQSRGIFIDFFLGILMYSCFLLILTVDVWAWIFQKIYFGTYNIPQINRADYFVLDRTKLTKLNVVQKIACEYCSYANGVVAWVKDVIMQVEIYSCAIKHQTPPKYGQREPERNDYYPYEQFV